MQGGTFLDLMLKKWLAQNISVDRVLGNTYVLSWEKAKSLWELSVQGTGLTLLDEMVRANGQYKL